MAWKKIKVGDLGRVVTGKTPKTSEPDNYNGPNMFVTPSDDMNVKYITSTGKTLTEKGKNSVKGAIIPAGTVCVSCIGSHLGKAIITTEECVTNQQINSIIVNTDKYDIDFVYYAMVLLGKKLNFHSKTSTAVPIINKSKFSSYEISCPSINEQRRIASLLSALDNKIYFNCEINENLLQQMESLYKAWFKEYVPFGGQCPPDWKKADIYSIANIIYGAPFASKLFNTDGDGLPIIRIRDLKEQAFVTYTTEQHPKGHLIKPGDIVVGMDGEFRPYIWGNTEAWLNQRVCIFVNKRPKGKAFVFFTIKPLLYQIEQMQVATTVIHIGKKDYDAFEFLLPDTDTLDQFDSITAPMIDQIVVNCLENKRLAEMRDTLLPRLMSGELDVTDLDL